MFEKGKILRKIWICLNKFFNKPVKWGKYKQKIVFLLKVSP